MAASLALPVCIPFGEVDTMDTGDTVDTVYKTDLCHLCQNPHVMPIYAPYVPSRLCNMESKSPTMHRLGNSVWWFLQRHKVTFVFADEMKTFQITDAQIVCCS